MRHRRVYLPLSGADLDALAGPDQALAPTSGYAVTRRLERAHPQADEEQLEYAAFRAAAAEAARRLDGASKRRVVGAADLDRDAVAEADGPDDLGRVRLGTPVPLRAVVSLHADEEPGSEDELQWYDVTELQSVRDRCG